MKYLLIGITLTIFAACSFDQEETMETQEITGSSLLSKIDLQEASIEEKLAYKRHHLTILAKWLGGNGELVESMEKVSVFDEPSPYLIEDLLDQQRANGRLSEDPEVLEEVISSLDAFKGIEGEVWYPTVFVMEGVQDDRGTKGDQTFVAVEDADENGEKFSGYELIDDGRDVQLVPLNTELTPEFVSNASLMVIELDFCGNSSIGQNAFDEIVTNPEVELMVEAI